RSSDPCPPMIGRLSGRPDHRRGSHAGDSSDTTKPNQEQGRPMKIQTLLSFSSTVPTAAAVICTIAFAGGAQAQSDFPSQPIRMIVGYAPGAIVDLTARQLAARMSEELGTPVVVENRPGGGGLLANEYVSRATNDG